MAEAIDQLAQSGKPVYAIIFDYEKYFDTGDKLKYMKAVIDMALRDPKIRNSFLEYIK